MNYEQIEDDCVQQITDNITVANTTVVAMPEVEADFSRPIGANNRVTVCYIQSTFGDHRDGNGSILDTGLVLQDETLHIDVLIQSRRRRSNTGAFALMREIRAALVGFRPTYCNKMYMIESGLQPPDERNNDIWTYSMRFACKSRLVEHVPDSNDPLLKKVTYDDPNFGPSFYVPNPVIPGTP